MFGTPEIDTALSRWMHFAIALQGHFAQSTFFYCSRWNGDERRGHLRYSAHLDLLAACLGYPALFALRLFQGCSGIRASCHFQTRSSLGRWLQRTWYTICFAKPIKKLHEFVMTSTVAQAHFQQILQNDGGLELWTLFPSFFQEFSSFCHASSHIRRSICAQLRLAYPLKRYEIQFYFLLSIASICMLGARR